MRGVGLCAFAEELRAVKGEKLLGIALIIRVTQDRLRRVVPLLMIQAIHTAKIRDTALGRNTCPAEKHDVVRSVDEFF